MADNQAPASFDGQGRHRRRMVRAATPHGIAEYVGRTTPISLRYRHNVMIFCVNGSKISIDQPEMPEYSAIRLRPTPLEISPRPPTAFTHLDDGENSPPPTRGGGELSPSDAPSRRCVNTVGASPGGMPNGQTGGARVAATAGSPFRTPSRKTPSPPETAPRDRPGSASVAHGPR